MNMLKRLGKMCAALVAVLASTGAVFAQANSIESFDVAQQGGNVVVRITTKEPLKSAPSSFTVANPARIVFDFAGTTNALGRNAQDVSQGELRSMNLVQGSDRTRLVLNLRRTVAHEVVLDGKSIVVTLTSAATVPTGAAPGQASNFAEGKVDSKHAIRDVDFRRGNAGEGRIVIDLTDTSTGIDIRQQGQNIVVEFLKTSLPENMRRRLDVVDFATPVQTVNTFQQGENVRMVIEAKGQWEHNAYQSETQFVVEVKATVADPTKLSQRAGFSGEKLSLNFQNVEVRAVLNVIADFTDLNIITSDTVSGSITLRLKDVPWDQALDIILKTRGLDLRKTGNVVWIAPSDELATREKLQLEAQAQIGELVALKTEVFQLNYRSASDFIKVLTDDKNRLLSKRGSAVLDPLSNKIYINDIPPKLAELARIIAETDVQPKQVMIEARIVEASELFNKNLGARLGYHDLGGNHGFLGKEGLRYSFGGGLGDVGGHAGAGAQGGTPVFIPDSLGVNLPAAGLNIFGAGQFSFILFNKALTQFLNMEISALEADGKGKTISSPRVLTANNVEAVIEQGTEIPFQQATSSGATSIAFRKASLSLKVKPQITPDGNIIMLLDVNKDEPGATTPSGIAITTKHIKTSVLVENGGTVVIGGIYDQRDRSDTTRIPFFGELPYIGFLFKNAATTTSKTELLVFITPRIVSERLTVR
jgi:type IV pilus assembly protein PilQ